MAKIKILLDSTGDIPPEWIEKLDVEIIPLHLLWEGSGQSEDDTRERAQVEDFWKRLAQGDSVPKTSQPTPLEFDQKIEKILGAGYEGVFVLTLSSKMSGTFNSAFIASKKYPDAVRILDTGLASSANALVTRRARELVDQGFSLDELQKSVEAEIKQRRFGAFFYVSDFDFLKKGGRISRFTGFVGSMLKLRVSLYIDDQGEMLPFAKSRGLEKTQQAVLKQVQEQFSPGSKVNISMVYCDSLPETQQLFERLQKVYDVQDVSYTPMGKVISSHVGPGASGFGIELLEK
ncbi:MAG TPA: DegV family protein [Thermotogota bacterium]|nr:DegV family protein [Thermotogota bacterium]HRW93644.1 DegV family protein [Thermotogota bacterium]